MNAGLIVGYVTQPNGNPISDAEIWISAISDSQTNAVENENAVRRPIAKTNSRGYFQFPFACFGANIAEIVGTSGSLNIFVGTQNNQPLNSVGDAVATKNFQVTGYLIKETLEADA